MTTFTIGTLSMTAPRVMTVPPAEQGGTAPVRPKADVPATVAHARAAYDAGRTPLRAAGYAVAGPEIISCPTCGRTQYPMIEIANEVEQRLRDEGFKKPLKIAIMGCVVNGPGEASDADIGIAGGKDEALLFIRGEKIRMLKGDIVGQLLDEIHKM